MLLSWMLVLVFSLGARAETVVISLGDPANVEAGTAIVNTAAARAEPPLQVDQWDDGSPGGFRASPIAVGRGRHGKLDATTLPNFHDGIYSGDGVININTDLFPVLEFTDVHVPAGFVIRPVGSRALVMQSLGHVRIDGVINCSGDDGSNASADITRTPAGGRGRCGGRDGGRGGSSTVLATAGLTEVAGLEGGAGSGGSASEIGKGNGGGGGSGLTLTGQQASPGKNFAGGNLGNAGVSPNSLFSAPGAGAGGGGGESYTLGGATPSSGAGGGGGGGYVEIYAVGDIIVTGSVLLNGGDGGDVSPGLGGGAGGGGAGGKLTLFSGGDLDVAGDVLLNGGAAGAADHGEGGIGGSGRVWASVRTGSAYGGHSGNFNPIDGGPGFEGAVNSIVGTYNLVTKLIDAGATRVRLRSVGAAPSSGAVTLYVASSDRPFSVGEADWKIASTLALGEFGRYLRVRAEVVSASSSTPVVVESLALDLEPVEQTQFDFSSCARVDAPRGPTGVWFLLIPLLLVWRLRRRHA
jgi:hypothetical protein